MTMLSDFYKFFNTADATVLPGHLREGKTAFGPDGKVTGTQAAATRILVDYPFPHSPVGAYTLNENDMLVRDPAISAIGFYSGWSIDASGGLSRTTDGYLINPIGMPAKPTACRRHELWGVWEATPDHNDHIYIDINHDGVNNWWRAYFLYENTPHFNIYLAQFIAGAWNYRAGNVYFTNVDPGPIFFHLIADDRGDRVSMHLATENLTTGVVETNGFTYTTASRTGKSNQRSTLGMVAAGDLARFYGCRIQDVE